MPNPVQNCPICKTALVGEEQFGRNCPHCGAAIRDALSSEIDETQIFQEQSQDSFDLTIELGESDPLSSSESDTIDHISLEQIPESDHESATIESDDFSAELSNEAKRQQTLSDEEMSDDDLGVISTDSAATLDSDDEPNFSTHSGVGDFTVDIHAVQEGAPIDFELDADWEGSLDLDTPNGQTVRQRDTVSGFRSSLPIKSRNLVDCSISGGASIGSPRTSSPGNVPDYELLDVLGEGGMGVVYNANQSSIARKVAVKMLKPSRKTKEEQRDKFISEAVITGELDHPNIVPIHDLGANDEGALFYSMKRVNGTPWQDVIKKKGLDENLDILLRVSDAVAFAHAHGVVHRDLKPENIMLGEFGEVLVMDWGLARVTDAFAHRGTIYQADSLGGTPAYMSPEMARGPVSTIDSRSDIYLLGAILYEVIGHRPPHSGRDVMRCLNAAAQNRIDEISYEGELKAIALRAMATRKEDRYQNVLEFQDAIRTYQSHSESLVLSSNAQQYREQANQSQDYDLYNQAIYGFKEALNLWQGNEQAAINLSLSQQEFAECALANGDLDLASTLVVDSNPDHAELLGRIDAAKKKREASLRRQRIQTRIIQGLVAAVLLAVSAGLYFVNQQRTLAVENADEARRQEDIAKDNEQKAVVAKVQAERAKEQEELAKDEALRLKDEAVEAKEQEEKAKDEAVKAQKLEETARIAADAARNEAVAAKEQEEKARQAEEYEAYISSIGLAAAKIEENAYSFATQLLADANPDQRHWEWGRLDYLCRLASQTFLMQRPVESVAYAPDGSAYATGDWDGKIVARSLDQGNRVLFERTESQYIHAVAYSPDGNRIAAGCSDHRVLILNASNGDVIHELRGHEDGVLSVSFAPDGKTLVSAGYDNTARIWDADQGKLLQTLAGHTWWVWDAEFSPSGNRLITVGQDRKAIVWELVSSEETEFRRTSEFLQHQGPIYAAAYSPKGEFVATAGYSGKILFWNPDNLSEVDYEGRIEGVAEEQSAFVAFTGHRGPVRSLAFSMVEPDLLASGSQDNSVFLWNVSSGDTMRVLRGHGQRVNSVAFSPTGGKLLSASQDSSVRQWDISGYEELRVLYGTVLSGHRDAVLSAQFSPDGDQVVLASRDRSATLWSVKEGSKLQEFNEGHQFLATSAKFFPDGIRLATAAGDQTVRLWNVTSGTEEAMLSQTGSQGVIAVNREGSLLVSGGPDGTIKVWNTTADQPTLDQQLLGHDEDVTAAAFSQDGTVLATGDQRGIIRLWEKTGTQWTEVGQLTGHTRAVTVLRFMPDQQNLISASGDNSCTQWDLASRTEIPGTILRHSDWVNDLAITSDGRFAVTTCDDGKARFWSLDTTEVLAEVTAPKGRFTSVSIAPDDSAALLTSPESKMTQFWEFAGSRPASIAQDLIDFDELNQSIWAARFAPDGKHLVAIGGNDARIWSLITGEEVATLGPHRAVATAVFAPNGRLICTASWDGSAKIWNAENGKSIVRLSGGHTSLVNSAEFSPNQSQILTASDDRTARIWNARTGKPTAIVFRGHRAPVKQATFSRDGSMVLTVSEDQTARIWDAASGDLIRLLDQHEGPVLCGTFSPDGRRVVTGGEEKKNIARVWDVRTGTLLTELGGHTAGITSVTFSPDSLRILTGSQDNSAKLWDAEKGKEILSLTGHQEAVTSVAFSPDGLIALTGSRDGSAILWMANDWRKEAELAFEP